MRGCGSALAGIRYPPGGHAGGYANPYSSRAGGYGAHRMASRGCAGACTRAPAGVGGRVRRHLARHTRQRARACVSSPPRCPPRSTPYPPPVRARALFLSCSSERNWGGWLRDRQWPGCAVSHAAQCGIAVRYRGLMPQGLCGCAVSLASRAQAHTCARAPGRRCGRPCGFDTAQPHRPCPAWVFYRTPRRTVRHGIPHRYTGALARSSFPCSF